MKQRLLPLLLPLTLLCENCPAITAGPDAFGYSVTDSNEPGGPGFEFVDISSTGTQLVFPVFQPSFQADDIATTVDLDYPFPFYGETISQLRVSSNGYLSTDPNDPGNHHLNANTLPSNIPPGQGGGARIYPCHDDMILDNFDNSNDLELVAFRVPADKLGRVFVQSFPSLPTHPFKNDTPCTIIQWDSTLQFFGGLTGKFSFQTLLFEDGTLYVSFPAEAAINLQTGRMTIGIQNADASIGLLYAGNQNGSVTPPQAIAFSLAIPPPPPIEITDFQVLDSATGEVSLSFVSNIGSAYLIESSPSLDFDNPTTTLSVPASEVTSEAVSRTLTVTAGTDFLRVREVEP